MNKISLVLVLVSFFCVVSVNAQARGQMREDKGARELFDYAEWLEEELGDLSKFCFMKNKKCSIKDVSQLERIGESSKHFCVEINGDCMVNLGNNQFLHTKSWGILGFQNLDFEDNQ